MSNLTEFASPKNVGELKEYLKNIPDYIPLGGRGHFGEVLEFYGCSVQIVKKKVKEVEYLILEIEYKGEEPD